MKKNRNSKWILSYGAVVGVFGLMIGQIGSLNFWSVFGAISGALVLIIINIVYVKSKSDKTPEYDERTIQNVQKFYFYSTNTFFILFFIMLGVLTAIDIKFISTLTLLIILFSYSIITGIISLLISKK